MALLFSTIIGCEENPLQLTEQFLNDLKSKSSSDLIADYKKHLHTENIVKAVVGRFHWNNSKEQDKERLVELVNTQVERLIIDRLHDQDLPIVALREDKSKIEKKNAEIMGTYKENKALQQITFFYTCREQEWIIDDLALNDIKLIEQMRLKYAPVVRHKGVKGLYEYLQKNPISSHHEEKKQ